ncbi:MAG: hypothetical protein K8S98_01570 [Planctomycetes bacterium]|nr:hypothetical protein [Planctomycetota bacterium]
MHAMGGRAAWDRTRCISWTFFNGRRHVWDKWTGDYRLEDGKRVVLMNVCTGQGKVFDDGKQVEDASVVADALARAKSIWINDSYWLIMPYKLKEDGVTLKYKGEDKLPDERAADVVVLSFANVGDTPENKYDVWIARDTGLVEQWSYYPKRDDEKPAFTNAWADWKSYGSIKLSGFRTDQRKLTEIAVFDQPPASLAKL